MSSSRLDSDRQTNRWTDGQTDIQFACHKLQLSLYSSSFFMLQNVSMKQTDKPRTESKIVVEHWQEASYIVCVDTVLSII